MKTLPIKSMTPEKIEELIKARTAELESLGSLHEKERQEFLQKTADRQQQANMLQGCILQLRDLLPKPKPDKATKKKK